MGGWLPKVFVVFFILIGVSLTAFSMIRLTRVPQYGLDVVADRSIFDRGPRR